MKNEGDVWAKKPYFVTSLKLSEHPLQGKARKKRLLYFSVLEYLVNSCVLDVEYANARLSQYRSFLAGEETVIPLRKNNSASAIRMVVDDCFKPWKRGNSFMLLCDIALIILHEQPRVKMACGMIAKFLNKRKQVKLNELFTALYIDKPIPRIFAGVENLIIQFRKNRDFTTRREIRIMVTATVSAGKSMLINAIVGKPVTRTALGVTTKKLCFIHNKPFEDGRFHLSASPLNLDATLNDLFSGGKEANCAIASYFRALGHTNVRVCLIDTPGVDSSLYPGHRKITQNAIREETYDKLICVLNEDQRGRKDTIKHLKYIRKFRWKVPDEKVIFVLNKVDDLDNAKDPISESISKLKADLRKIGYKNPVICPLSAYFSLLLKRKKNNEKLSDDEQDDFDSFEKKINKPEYDLSKYYDRVFEDGIQDNDGLVKLGHISGLYGLENILYGGQENEKSIH